MAGTNGGTAVCIAAPVASRSSFDRTLGPRCVRQAGMLVAALGDESFPTEPIYREFADRSIDLLAFHDVANLLSELHRLQVAAVLVADEDRLVRQGLISIRTRLDVNTPLVVVGPGDAEAIGRALLRGADDYATHVEGPAGLVRRLLGRVRAAAGEHPVSRHLIGRYGLDIPRKTLASADRELRLTSDEFAIARALFEQLGRPLSARALSLVVLGRDDASGARSIEQHIYRLRKKCAQLSGSQDTRLTIESVYRVGYRFRIEQ